MQRISVIVPCYNAVRTLARALNSCLAQTQAAQIIVVDDASEDASAQVAAFYALKDPRVQLVRVPKNAGPAKARNLGASHAVHPLLAFLDADDEYLPRALANAAACLHENPLRPALHLDVEYFGFPADILAFPAFEQLAQLMSNAVTSSLVVRREFFVALKGFPEDEVFRRFGGEDLVFSQAVNEIYGCPLLCLKSRGNFVRLHYHPNSHVAKFFYREMGVMEKPIDEGGMYAAATARFMERVRNMVWSAI